jgi:hypothetical protein
MERWQAYAGRSLGEAFQAAYEDIKEHGEEYLDRFRKEVLGGKGKDSNQKRP